MISYILHKNDFGLFKVFLLLWMVHIICLMWNNSIKIKVLWTSNVYAPQNQFKHILGINGEKYYFEFIFSINYNVLYKFLGDFPRFYHNSGQIVW